LDRPEFLYLTTAGWKTGRPHRIEIWFVEHDERYYVMSERRERSHWVKNIAHNSKVSFDVNRKTFAGSAMIVNQKQEPKLAAEVSKLMDAKYRWDRGLIVELDPAGR
jgi:deazaflavin-dependent oxidoreductase (nitroreductase family)